MATLDEGDLRVFRRHTQMVFQDPYSSLNPRMTLLELIGEPLLNNGVRDAATRTERVAELLSLVGLRPEYIRRYPHAFSGGPATTGGHRPGLGAESPVRGVR